jgi:hypothetical protein
LYLNGGSLDASYVLGRSDQAAIAAWGSGLVALVGLEEPAEQRGQRERIGRNAPLAEVALPIELAAVGLGNKFPGRKRWRGRFGVGKDMRPSIRAASEICGRSLDRINCLISA